MKIQALKRTAMVGVAVASLLSMAACGGSDASEGTGAPDADGIITVKLGMVGPMTGPAALYSRYMQQTLETYGDHFEAEYDVRFDVIEEDDQASPEETARAVSRLINEANVDVILGPPMSGNAIQVAEVIQRSQVPWLLAGPTADEAVDYSIQPNWAFQTNYTNTQHVAVLGELLFADDAKVGVVYSADGYGQAGLAQLEAWASENGHAIAVEEALQPGSSDANAIVSRLRSEGVDALYMVITQGADTATVTRAMTQADVAPAVVMTTPSILTDFKDLAEPSEWANIQFLDPRNFLEGGDAEVLDAVREETGEAPAVPTGNIGTYAILDAYAQAVQEVGGTTDREAVRKAMEDLEAVHIASKTIEQPFSAEDHSLYDDEPANWLAYGFDEDFNLVVKGTAQDCLEGNC